MRPGKPARLRRDLRRARRRARVAHEGPRPDHRDGRLRHEHQLACRHTPSGTASLLEECWNHIDYISAHHYSRNDDDDTASFLSQGVELDAIITQYRGLLDHVRAVKRSLHRVHISFDEWNVWYREMDTQGLPRGAPPARGDLQPPGRPRVRGVPPLPSSATPTSSRSPALRRSSTSSRRS